MKKVSTPASSMVRTLVISGLLFTGLASCEKPSSSAPPQSMERPPAPVSAVVAVARNVPQYIDGLGKCVAREVVSIQPQVSGRITKINFTDGADVKTGELLFTIDKRPFQAALDMANANLVQQKAVQNLALLEFNRNKGLVSAKTISQEEYDTKKNALDVANAEVKQREVAVETAQINLDYCEIHSPIDGRAGQRLVDLGNVVTANSGPNASTLLVIQRLDPIYADFTVTENDLTSVQLNMARGTLKTEVRLPDQPSTPISGSLTFLDNAVQDQAGTVKLRATLPNADHRLWPGRFVKVRLVLSTLKDAVLVPVGAPQLSAQGSFLYVIKSDSTAELRPVSLGQRQDDLVVVNSGLKAGEKIVTNGQLGVTPGGKVQEAAAAPPEGVPGAPSAAAAATTSTKTTSSTMPASQTPKAGGSK